MNIVMNPMVDEIRKQTTHIYYNPLVNQRVKVKKLKNGQPY